MRQPRLSRAPTPPVAAAAPVRQRPLLLGRPLAAGRRNQLSSDRQVGAYAGERAGAPAVTVPSGVDARSTRERRNQDPSTAQVVICVASALRTLNTQNTQKTQKLQLQRQDQLHDRARYMKDMKNGRSCMNENNCT